MSSPKLKSSINARGAWFKSRQRWCVFISGRGSNLAALLDLQNDIEVSLVVSSSAQAYGLLRAKRAGVPTWVMSKPIDWQITHGELIKRSITHIFLAGFMRIVPADFIAKWEGRILNLHPSLLPMYPGLKSIERAYGEKSDIGVTVHEVIPSVDEGPHLAQRLSLKGIDLPGYSLAQTEFKVHRDEQRLVREVVFKGEKRWKN